MTNKQKYLDYLIKIISSNTFESIYSAKIGLNDKAKHFESFIAPFLDAFWDCNLTQSTNSTEAAIDLFDYENNIFVQVSNNATKTKIKKTLIGLSDRSDINKISTVKFLFIGGKVKLTFDSSTKIDTDILNTIDQIKVKNSKFNFEINKDVFFSLELIHYLNNLNEEKLKLIYDKFINLSSSESVINNETNKQILQILNKQELNKQDTLDVYRLVEDLIWNDKPITALKNIEVIKLKNFGNIDKLKLSILENYALRLSGVLNKVLTNLEVLVDLCIDEDKIRIYSLLTDINRNLNLDENANEYLLKLNNLDSNSSRTKILNAVLKNEINDDWLIGDPNSREIVISYILKSEYYFNKGDFSNALINIELGLKNAVLWSKVDLLVLKILALIEFFKANPDSTEILSSLNSLSDEVTKSEIIVHKVKYWILKIKISQLGILDLTEEEGNINKNFIDKFLNEDFNTNTESIITELISIGFIVTKPFVEKLLEVLNKSKHKPTQHFLLIFVTISWNFIDTSKLLDFLIHQKAESINGLFNYLLSKEYEKYIEYFIELYGEELFYYHLNWFKDPQLSLKIIYSAYRNVNTKPETLYNIELIKYYESQMGDVDEGKIRILLNKINFKNCSLQILNLGRTIAFNIKCYDIEEKIIEILELKKPSLLTNLYKVENYFNQGFFLKSKNVMEELLTEAKDFISLNNAIKNRLLFFYFQSCIKTQSNSNHINNIQDLSLFVDTPSYELYFNFCEYLIKNYGYCDDFCDSLEFAYKLIDSENFDHRYFTNSIVLAGFKSRQVLKVEDNTFVKLSSGIWLSIQSIKGLQLGATIISKTDKRYSKLINKKVGDTIDWLENNYSNTQIKIEVIANLFSYIQIRGFEKITELNQIDNKFGYTLNIDFALPSYEIFSNFNKLNRDIQGVDEETIKKFEDGEYLYFLFSTLVGGVYKSYCKLQELEGLLNSNLGNIENTKVQYLNLERLIASQYPVYTDLTSTILLLETKLLDDIIKILNIKLPNSILKYLRDSTTTFSNDVESFAIGFNSKTQSTYIQNHSLVDFTNIKNVADKLENECQFYSTTTQIDSESFLIQNITKDISLPVYLNIKEPESGIYTESADFIYYLQSTEKPDYKPEYFSTYVLIQYLFNNKIISWDKFLDVYCWLSYHKSSHLTLNSEYILKTALMDISKEEFNPEKLKKLNLSFYFSPKYSNNAHTIQLLFQCMMFLILSNNLDKIKFQIFNYLFDSYLVYNLDLEDFKKKLINIINNFFQGEIALVLHSYHEILINFIKNYSPPPQSKV